MLGIAARVSVETPEHSIVFAALDAEESGLNGSKAFIGDPPIPRAAIVMNVNLDMVARDAKNILFATGTFQYPFLKAYLKRRGAAAGRASPRARRIEPERR